METLILSCDSFNREEILYNPSSYLNFIGRVVFCNHNQDFVTRDPGYCFQRAEIRDGADILMGDGLTQHLFKHVRHGAPAPRNNTTKHLPVWRLEIP